MIMKIKMVNENKVRNISRKKKYKKLIELTLLLYHIISGTFVSLSFVKSVLTESRAL